MQNNYPDGQFQSVISSFEPKKSYRVSQSTFGSSSNLGTKTLMRFNPRLIALGEAGSLMGSASKGMARSAS
jgi:hypothetical protein